MKKLSAIFFIFFQISPRSLKENLSIPKYYHKSFLKSENSFISWYGDNKGRCSYQIWQRHFKADMIYNCVKVESKL